MNSGHHFDVYIQCSKYNMLPLHNDNFTLLQYLPRFQPENLDKNAQIFERVNAMAARKGCTPSQLALAWVHHQGNDVNLPYSRHNKNREFQPKCGGTFCEADSIRDGQTRVICCRRWSLGWPVSWDGTHMEGFRDTAIVVLEVRVAQYI